MMPLKLFALNAVLPTIWTTTTLVSAAALISVIYARQKILVIPYNAPNAFLPPTPLATIPASAAEFIDVIFVPL
jgi:hypothetical protein